MADHMFVLSIINHPMSMLDFVWHLLQNLGYACLCDTRSGVLDQLSEGKVLSDYEQYHDMEVVLLPVSSGFLPGTSIIG